MFLFYGVCVFFNFIESAKQMPLGFISASWRKTIFKSAFVLRPFCDTVFIGFAFFPFVIFN